MSIYDNLGQPHTGQSYMLVMVIKKKMPNVCATAIATFSSDPNGSVES